MSRRMTVVGAGLAFCAYGVADAQDAGEGRLARAEFHPEVSVDNYGNDDSGRYRLFGLAGLANLLHEGDYGYVGWITPVDEPGDQNTLLGGYQAPLGRWPASLGVSGYWTDQTFTSRGDGGTELGSTFDGYEVEFAFRYHINRLRRAALDTPELGTLHELYALLAPQRINTRLRPTTGDEESAASLDSLPLTLGYEFRTVASTALSFSGSLEYLRNLSVGRYGDGSDFEDNRAGADASFGLARTSLQAGYVWPEGWSARLAAFGQYAREPLASPYLFSLGGPLSVRALDTGETLGDLGFDLRAETFTPYAFEGTPASQAVGAFVEYGATRRERVDDPEDPRTDDAVGIGVSWSWRGIEHLELDVDLAYLVTGSIVRSRDIDGLERLRPLFSLAMKF
jgi:hemolysin activation/secretion protein